MQESIQALKRACPVCESLSAKPLFQQRFAQMSGGSVLPGYDVVICENCGMGFADHIPSQDWFDSYYRDMSKYEYAHHGGQQSAYDLAHFTQDREYIAPFIPSPQSSILEIGCATGGLMSSLKDAGFQRVVGLDPSPACSRSAHELYGLEVRTGTIAENNFEAGSFDLVILIGVLEHVRELKNAISDVRSLLAADGCVYIGVPDASRYAEHRAAPYQEFSVEHINFFGPSSLTNLFAQAGFECLNFERAVVESSVNTTTPIVRAVFRKIEDGVTSDRAAVTINKDVETEPQLSKYIANSAAMDQRINQIMGDLADSQTPIMVWGAGSHSLRLMETTRLREANIIQFIDSNPKYQDQLLGGVPVVAPEAALTRTEPILISSCLFQGEIVTDIEEKWGLNNKLILLYEV